MTAPNHFHAPAGRKRRVGLNAHLLSSHESYRSAGVSGYVRNLLAYLPQADDSLSYLAFVGRGVWPCAPTWQCPTSLWHTERPWARIAWEQMALPWGIRREKLDLLHVPAYVAPVATACPTVVTIHDLSFYLYPELFKPFNRVYLRHFTRLTASRVERIIAVSEHTRADVVRILGIPGEQVVAIPNGVGEEMRPVHDPALLNALRRRHHLPERMILFVGTLEPRKNLVTLLQAYALLRRTAGWEHRLVIGGAKGWYYQAIYAAVEHLGLRDEVLFPGYIPQQELPLWYNAADLFVYPSLYEGFGLPPLEAMACGTPVVVSNTSSLPEVVGEAGLTVDPRDAPALAEAMRSVLQDRHRHQSLREAGLARARGYSWRATALKTTQLYHQVLGDA